MLKSKKKRWIIILIIFILVFFMHFFLNLNYGDDLYFSTISLNELINWLMKRYCEWSSRIFIEATLVITLKLPNIIWMLINTSMIFLLGFSISYLFTKNTFKEKLICLLSVFLLPIYLLNEAGWYATSINYLWPCALGVFSLIPIKNAIKNSNEKKWMYPIYTFALLFACNHELMCLIVLSFYLLSIIYLWKNRKINKFLLFQLFLSIMSIVFIFICPDNSLRVVTETATRYPEFANFNIIHKFVLGILSTISITLLDIKLPFLILSILIPIALTREKNIFIKLISYIPMTAIIIFNIFPSIFPTTSRIYNALAVYANKVDFINMKSPMLYILLFGSTILIISIVISLYYIFFKENNLKKYLLPTIFLAGLFSRLVMGFSSTLYASGQRTFLFYNVSIIICIIIILMKIKNEKNDYNLIITGIIIALFQMIQTALIC